MTSWLLYGLIRSLLLAASMFWTVLWALVLGFTRSAVVRVLLTRDQTERNFGGQGLREVALAAAWGAGSFAPSYAAVAMARTLFRKHGSLLCALVFLFASTNLSAEFLLVLWLLLGWRVMLLEMIGGLLFITVLWAIVRVSWPEELAREAHERQEESQDRLGEDGGADAEGNTLRDKVRSRRNWAAVADGFVRGWSSTWWQLLLGFVLAGLLAVFVPHHWWQGLQVGHRSAVPRVLENALVGPVIAAVTCITSLGNLPLARLLYLEGLNLSGVLSFLFADLLALPLLLIYRENFGLKTAAYVAAALFGSAVIAGAAVGLFASVFHFASHLAAPPELIVATHRDWRLPTLPNLVAILVAGALVVVRVRYGGWRGEGTGDA